LTTVSVLGIGRMGAAVARRLVAADFDVVLWNRSRAAADEVVTGLDRTKVRVASSAPEAVANAQFVICAFANGEITSKVLLEAEFLDALPSDALVADMGTSGVEIAHSLDAAFRASGRTIIDAPVSGSVATVDAGQLLVLAGGDPSAVDAFRPVFGAYAKKVSYLGPAGSGQAMKLAVNLVVHSLNAALSEALVLAEQAGIDPSDAYDVFQDSVIASPFVNYKRSAFLDDATPVAFSLDLVLKDLRLVAAAAAALGVPAPTSAGVAAAVSDSIDAGYGDADMAGLKRFLSEGTDSPIG
jgi:3-hydroxyisobutyrate dehydrogenase